MASLEKLIKESESKYQEKHLVKLDQNQANQYAVHIEAWREELSEKEQYAKELSVESIKQLSA